jgi:L-asparagine transporter-like permease
VLLSGAGVLLAVLLARFTPKAYAYLQGVALFGAIIVWMLILLSHLRFRRAHPAATLPVRTPFFPMIQLAGLALLAGVLITMGMDKDWTLSWVVGVPWLIVITAVYFIWKARRGARGGAPEAPLALGAGEGS